MMPHPISVVVPLFNEEQNIGELHRRLSATLAEFTFDYELILVNDGSHDATPELLNQLARIDSHVRVVHLSRNFGHQPAICAGLETARGEAVIVMDGDLQDPPEVIGQLLERWREGYEVVYAVRNKRKENLLRRGCYFAFYRILKKISDLQIPVDSGDFCLMDRKVVSTLNALPEKSRFVRGLRAFVGFQQTGLAYERAERDGGRSKYTLSSLVRLALDGLLGFSTLPLTVVTLVGACLLCCALLLGVGLTGQLAFAATLPSPWAWVTAAGLFLTSVQLLGLGIVGQYIQQIFVEVKGRPTFVIREIVQQPARAGKRTLPVRAA